MVQRVGGPYQSPEIALLGSQIEKRLQIDAINARRNRKRLKAEKHFVTVPSAAGSKHSADRWERDVADLLAVEIKKFQLRAGILFILRKQLAAEDGRALQHGVRLRDQFLPCLAIIIPRVGDKHAVARRVLICRDVEFAVINFSTVQKILSCSDPRRRRTSFHVHQKQFRLGPSLGNADQQPVPIVRKMNARPVFRVAPFAKNQLVVVVRIIPQRVIVNVPVVHLLPLRHIPFFRIPRVIKARIIELPCDRRSPCALNGVGQHGAGLGLNDVQRAHLRPTRRSSVSHILPVLAGLKPIEGNRPVSRKRVGIN